MRLRSACLSLILTAGVGVSLPVAGAAAPSVGQLSSALGAQRSEAQALAGSARALDLLIGRLAGQVSLIEGRRAAVEAELGRDQTALDGVRADQAAAQTHLARLAVRLRIARLVLARELVSSFESEPPDVLTVVLGAHGFADLLDRLEFVRVLKQHEHDVIVAVTTVQSRTETAARQLAALAVRDRAITVAVSARAQAVAAISGLLQGRLAALQDARAARLAALQATRARTGELQRALTRLKAELAASAGRAYGPWAIPQAIVTCESGGQNLGPNSAGASGYYQFLPSTWSGLGGSTPAAYLAPKSEQDRLAAKLWDHGRGARNWDCAAIVGFL